MGRSATARAAEHGIGGRSGWSRTGQRRMKSVRVGIGHDPATRAVAGLLAPFRICVGHLLPLPWICAALLVVATPTGLPGQSTAEPGSRSAGRSGAPPLALLGEFVDDYSIEYTIGELLWTQGSAARYHVVEWNAGGRYVLARNDTHNPSAAGLWSRIDWVRLDDSDFAWAYCYAIYDAGSLDEARTAPPSVREEPRTGCNGFPFSRMRRPGTRRRRAPPRSTPNRRSDRGARPGRGHRGVRRTGAPPPT